MSKIVAFYNGPFSQWYPSIFIINNVTYGCCEQYMMAEKAKLFGDVNAYKLIMKTNSPREQKRLGRLVCNFNEKVWKKNRYNIVLNGNRGKFSQNEGLRNKLLATGNATIVEASPTDTIWGVGLRSSDPRIKDSSKWRGLNLLGVALMQVRDEFR